MSQDFLKSFEVVVHYNKILNEKISTYFLEKDENPKVRNDVLFAFDKLVGHLIDVYQFSVESKSKSELKADCVKFLENNIGKFNPEKSSKAFSYFNVVAKNWLVQRALSEKRRKKKAEKINNADC